MTDDEAARVLGALADEPLAWLQEGTRVRWEESTGTYRAVVTRRTAGHRRNAGDVTIVLTAVPAGVKHTWVGAPHVWHLTFVAGYCRDDGIRFREDEP